jgi:hypothetical protein
MTANVKTPEQAIEIIIEHLAKGSAQLSALEKSRFFAEDWPELNEIKQYVDEAREALESYNAKWKEES